MPSPAIRIENLGKRYRLGATHSQTLGALLSSTAGRLFGRHNGHAPAPKLPGNGPSQIDDDGYFWALKDVSFDVQPGEVVGIIGRNGAGKSTLLKILSNIVSPTTGHVELHGRVASLLEVGTGFHSELTGRENVYLNGAILGMTNAEVRRKFDEIVAFAEIDQFIDTPVKRYSSGMYVRLAFAVAAHLESEILIVDEVLAVGDADFQQKCLGRMKSVSNSGRTVLFTSHNSAALSTICTRGICLSVGTPSFDGPLMSALSHYVQHTRSTLAHTARFAPCNVTPRVEVAALLVNQRLSNIAHLGDALAIDLHFVADVPVRYVYVGFVIYDAKGNGVINANNSYQTMSEFSSARSTGTVRCDLGPLSLMPGLYTISFWIGNTNTNSQTEQNAIVFEVLPRDLWGSKHSPPQGASAMWWPTRFEVISDVEHPSTLVESL